MFNILVNSEYEWLFETLKAEAPEFFSLKLADFSFPDERHILLSPSYINGKTNVGILKQKDKFILH